MSTNVSLGNAGTSLNFDGQALQNQQEAEIEQEEQQQQHELRQLLSQAFDELDDDILSVASSDGDTANTSHLSSHQDRSYNPHLSFKPIHHEVSLASQTSFFPRESFTTTGTPQSNHGARGAANSVLQQSQASSTEQNMKHLGQDSGLKTGQPGLFQDYWEPGGHSQWGSNSPGYLAHHWGTSADEVEMDNLQPYYSTAGDFSNKLVSSERDPQLQHLDKQASYTASDMHTDDWDGTSGKSYSRDNNGSPWWDTLSQNQNRSSEAGFGPYGNEERQAGLTLSKAAPSGKVQNARNTSEKEFRDDYKVTYKNPKVQESGVVRSTERDVRQEFMEPDGHSEEAQQLSQLQALYKSRGRQLEDLTADLESLRQESSKERRMLKHLLSVATGEKEGLATSLKENQQVLQDTKEEQAKTAGKLRAAELQIQVLKDGKDELAKRLQSTETTIENLTHQLVELQESESLSNARKQHESIVSSMQQRYNSDLYALNEKLDASGEVIAEKNKEIEKLWQQVREQRKQVEELQISRADVINQLNHRLEESQQHCQSLLEASSTQEVGRLKAQLQQALAAKKMSEDLCTSLQMEVKELKQELNMVESACSLGVPSHQGQLFADDSMSDLGIRKTLDFSTPVSTAKADGSQPREELLANLRRELERCLGSNRQKRALVAELQKEKQGLQEKFWGLQDQQAAAEARIQELQVKLKCFEDLYGGDHQNSAVVSRLKKDIENLQQEKRALVQDIDDYKTRLNEITASETRLTEINQQLNLQMSQMVRQHDHDKTEALERCKRTCEDIHKSSRELLERNLRSEFFADKQELIMKYERQLETLREEVQTAQEELGKVKELYIQASQDLGQQQDKLNAEYDARLKTEMAMLRKQMEEEKRVFLATREAEEKESTEAVRRQLKLELEEKYKQDQKMEIEKQIAQGKIEWHQEQETAAQQAVIAAEKKWTEKIEKISMEMEHKMEAERVQWETDKQVQVEAQMKQCLEKEHMSWQVKADQETLEQVELAVQAAQCQWKKDMQRSIAELQAELTASHKDHAAEVKALEYKLQQEVAQRQADLKHHLEAQCGTIKEAELSHRLAQQKIKLEEEAEKRLKEELDKLQESKAEEVQRCLIDQEERLCGEWRNKLEVEVNQAVNRAVAACEGRSIEKHNKETEAAKQEMMKWKAQAIELQDQLKAETQRWEEERGQMLQEKDEERRQAVISVRQQCQNDYQRFISDSKATLSAALASARQEHERELEKLAARHQEEIAALRESEQELQKIVASWNASDSPTQRRTKHQLVQRAEKLQREVEKREKLLQQADAHMQQEVEKLRESMAHSYAKQRESDQLRLQHQLTQYSKAMQQGQRERTHLERQMETMAEVFRKEKELLEQQFGQLQQELEEKTKAMAKLQDYEEDYHAQVQQLLEMEDKKHLLQDQLEERECDMQSLSQEKDKLQQELAEVEAVLKEERTRMSKDLQTCREAIICMKEEKARLMEELSTAKQQHQRELGESQRQFGEARERIRKMEAALAAVNKQHVEDIDKVQLRLKTAHKQQMEQMAQQLAQAQNQCRAALEEAERQHQKEKEELANYIRQQTEHVLAHTPTQTDTDDGRGMLKDEYTEIVKKVKGEVMNHISESNQRAAAAFKTHLWQEQLHTISHLRRRCKSRLRSLLRTSMERSAGEDLWMAVEHSLDCLFDSVSSSFSFTPNVSTTTMPHSIEKKAQSLTANRNSNNNYEVWHKDSLGKDHQLAKNDTSSNSTSSISGRISHTPLSTPRSLESEHLELPSHLGRVELFDQGCQDGSVSELQGSAVFYPLVPDDASSLADLHSDTDMEFKIQSLKADITTRTSKNDDTDRRGEQGETKTKPTEAHSGTQVMSSGPGSASAITPKLHKVRGSQKSDGIDKTDNDEDWKEVGMQNWSTAVGSANLWQAFTDLADLHLDSEKSPRKQLHFDTYTLDQYSDVGAGRDVSSPKIAVSPARDRNSQANSASAHHSALISKSGDFTKPLKKLSVRYKSLDELLGSPERDAISESLVPEREIQPKHSVPRGTAKKDEKGEAVHQLHELEADFHKTGAAHAWQNAEKHSSRYGIKTRKLSEGEKSLICAAAKMKLERPLQDVNELLCTPVARKRTSDNLLPEHKPRTVHSMEKVKIGREEEDPDFKSKQRTRSAENLTPRKISSSSQRGGAQSISHWKASRVGCTSQQAEMDTKAEYLRQVFRDHKRGLELLQQSSEAEKFVEGTHSSLSHMSKAKWHSEQALHAHKNGQTDNQENEGTYQYTPLQHFLTASPSTSLLSTYSVSEGDLRFLPYEISARFTDQF